MKKLKNSEIAQLWTHCHWSDRMNMELVFNVVTAALIGLFIVWVSYAEEKEEVEVEVEVEGVAI